MTNHSKSNGSKQTKNALFTDLLIAGTSACLADAATFPFDTAKVRLQLQGESAASNIVQTVHRFGMNKSNKLLNSLPKRSVVSTNTKNNAFATTSGRGFISTAFPIPAKTVEIVAVNPSIEANAIAAKPMMQYRGLFGTITTIARQEGARSLYNGKILIFFIFFLVFIVPSIVFIIFIGLSAGLQRQMVFASVRLGMYDTVKVAYQKILNENPNSLNIMGRVLAGMTTGAMAVIVGQPTEVVKIRFQGQKRIPGTSLKYTSTPATYRQIGREEGIRGLWKGATPNIGRNAVVNVSEIVCYDIVKDCLIVYGQMRDNIYCHFTAAVVAGRGKMLISLNGLSFKICIVIYCLGWNF